MPKANIASYLNLESTLLRCWQRRLTFQVSKIWFGKKLSYRTQYDLSKVARYSSHNWRKPISQKSKSIPSLTWALWLVSCLTYKLWQVMLCCIPGNILNLSAENHAGTSLHPLLIAFSRLRVSTRHTPRMAVWVMKSTRKVLYLRWTQTGQKWTIHRHIIRCTIAKSTLNAIKCPSTHIRYRDQTIQTLSKHQKSSIPPFLNWHVSLEFLSKLVVKVTLITLLGAKTPLKGVALCFVFHFQILFLHTILSTPWHHTSHLHTASTDPPPTSYYGILLTNHREFRIR